MLIDRPAAPLNRARWLLASLAVAALLVSLAPPARAEDGGAPASDRCVLRAEVSGVISPATVAYLEDALEDASRQRCQALLVVLDTPGGLLDATRGVVQLFLSSPVPVVVHVAPRGARAASAGLFLALAAHVAAMAPGTHIGAAHPVTVTGGDPGGEGRETMGRKIENDTTAFARAVAQHRDRNADWAELAVRESASATASEAVALDVVDLVAPDERALLAALDGRVVTLDAGGARRLATAGVEPADFEMSIQQRALAVLGNPTLAYLLLMLGMLGLLIELFQPGLVIPGAAGIVALLLAAVGLGSLPVELGGLVLLLLAGAFFVAELLVASYGLLALGGAAALVAGSLLLFDTRDPEFFVEPSLRVSWTVVVPSALVVAGAALALAVQARKVARRRARAGASGMIAARGVAADVVGPSGGHVHSEGERWRAVSREPIPAGAPVEVVAVDGLVLEVRRVRGYPPSAGGDLPGKEMSE